VLAYEVGLRLSAAGHEVLVLAPEQGEAQAPMPPLVVERFGWLGQGKKLGDYDLKDPRSMVKLGDFFRAGSAASWRMARRTKPDLVIAFWAFPCGVFARGLKAALGVPYAVWALGSDINSYYRPGTRALIREVLRGAALCGADGFKLCAQVERIAGRGCAFLPSARTLPAMPSALREGPVRRLLFVGRLEAVKGPDVLVEAFEEVAGELPELSLEVVGDGALGEELRGRVSRAGLGDRVKFAGRQGPGYIAEALGRSDVLVIPSRGDSIPLVFGEAMQARRPVITSDIEDFPELHRRFGVGVAFETGRASSLAARLREVYRAGLPAQEGDLAQAAHALSVASSVEQLEALLARVGKG
jgi:glycosyltransferase involved in cell wall biosynthesis